MQQQKTAGIFSIPVLVAALGYFVDIYDLLLFTIVREPSLAGIGINKADTAAMIASSTKIINWQMIGLLIGGILWGIIGDKKGRLSVLFGSIMLYSVANFATGFVETVQQYAMARFIAGIGLAGELGAGITLVSELLPKEKRGIGTSLVAGVGLSGAVAAYFTYKFSNDWRLCYMIGGGLGLGLLILRISVAESGMFQLAKHSDAARGNFLMFFNNKKRFINTSSKSLLFAIFYNRFSIYYIPNADTYTINYTRCEHSIIIIQRFWRRVLALRKKLKKNTIDAEISYLIVKINKEIVGESTRKVLTYMVNKFRSRLNRILRL